MKNCNNYEYLLARPNLVSEIDTELAARSLREFVQQAWPVVEPATRFVPGWHIDAICEHLEAVTSWRWSRGTSPFHPSVASQRLMGNYSEFSVPPAPGQSPPNAVSVSTIMRW